MDKALIQRMYEMVGAIKMADATGKFVSASRYILLKQIKDAKLHKQLDMDWMTFCKEMLGRDQKTVDGEIKLLEEFGEYFMRAIERLHLTKRDFIAIDKGLPEDAKEKIKKGVIPISGKEFKVSEIEDNFEEFNDAIELLKNNLRVAEKEKNVFEKEIRHHEKKETEAQHKIATLEKELSALKPPVTDEDRLKRFEEQLDIVYNKLADCSHMVQTVMDFSLILKSRDAAVKYRGVCKAVIGVIQNLEDKIGEVD